jgi:hypothetical protein
MRRLEFGGTLEQTVGLEMAMRTQEDDVQSRVCSSRKRKFFQTRLSGKTMPFLTAGKSSIDSLSQHDPEGRSKAASESGSMKNVLNSA